MMFSYITRIKLFLCFITIVSCSSPMNQIDAIQKELLSEVEYILCPNIKFIEGLDKLTITNQNLTLKVPCPLKNPHLFHIDLHRES